MCGRNGSIAKWRAFIFDLDDTLYPEVSFVRSGFREVAKWCGSNLGMERGVAYEELLSLFENGAKRNTFDAWVESHDLPIALVPEMVGIYRGHSPDIEPYKGVRELLALVRRNYKTGLLSDGVLSMQERKLAALKFKDMFDVVVFSDRWGRDYWKPSQRPYLFALDALDVKPEEAVYVGDNPGKDFLACRQLGMSSVWVRHPASMYAELNPESADHAADYVIQSITDVMSVGLERKD